MPFLDSAWFDNSDWKLEDDKKMRRAWRTPAGDAVAMFYFDLAPEFTFSLDDIDAVRDYGRKQCTSSGFGLIESEVVQAGNSRAVRTIFKSPQKPTGHTYLASLTIPFRDFTFVIKTQCAETGITCVRENIIFDELQQAGVIKLIYEHPPRIIGWTHDPYDLRIQAPLMKNLSEDEEFDERFPDHPLSRSRAILHRIEQTLHLTEEVRSSAPFVYPSEPVEVVSKKKRWWKRGDKT